MSVKTKDASHGGRFLKVIDAATGRMEVVTDYRWRRAKPVRRSLPEAKGAR